MEVSSDEDAEQSIDLATRSTPLLVARVRPSHSVSADNSVLSSTDAGHLGVHATGRTFPIDMQLWGSSQEQAWQQIGQPLVQTVLSGVSATLLATGCCGAGKTYTVSGQGIRRLLGWRHGVCTPCARQLPRLATCDWRCACSRCTWIRCTICSHLASPMVSRARRSSY